MINRLSFLRLVRNRVAAGVLCSGMLTDALKSFELVEVFPSAATVVARGNFSALLKPGLSEIWRSQYMNQPTKYPSIIEKTDGL